MPEKRKSRPRNKSNDTTLLTRDWIDAARKMLIRDGHGALKVDRLARECKVTRGGFYWRFKNQEDLQKRLLEEWRTTNTTPMLDALRSDGTPKERLDRTFHLWLEEKQFDPAFDRAIRAWAATSKKVAKVVHNMDNIRLEAFEEVYRDAGYSPMEAFIRARVTYFCQVGYYTLDIHESRKRRDELYAHYYVVLTGMSVPQEEIEKELRTSRVLSG